MLKKTQIMLLSTCLCCDDITMTAANCVIKKVHSTKFLSVVIDEKLCWWDHIELMHIKLSKSMGMLKAASIYVPHDVLLLIFMHSLRVNYIIWFIGLGKYL